MNFQEKPAETIEELREQLRERDLLIGKLERERDEARAEAAKERENALTDPLTGLKNRRGLEDAAKYIFPELRPESIPGQRAADRETKNIAVLQLDIDKFNEINDQYGHDEGDRILCKTAEFLAASVRPTDVVARVGGDEFVIILNDATEEVLHKFEDPDSDPPLLRLGFVPTEGERQQRVSFSGGITFLKQGETLQDLKGMIGRADKALYESKRGGRDRITLYRQPAAVDTGDLPADEAEE